MLLGLLIQTAMSFVEKRIDSNITLHLVHPSLQARGITHPTVVQALADDLVAVMRARREHLSPHNVLRREGAMLGHTVHPSPSAVAPHRFSYHCRRTVASTGSFFPCHGPCWVSPGASGLGS